MSFPHVLSGNPLFYYNEIPDQSDAWLIETFGDDILQRRPAFAGMTLERLFAHTSFCVGEDKLTDLLRYLIT